MMKKGTFKERTTKEKKNMITYNLGHDILELYNVLVQIRLTTSKMKLDI